MALPAMLTEHAASAYNSKLRTVHASTLSTRHAHFVPVQGVRSSAVTTPPDSDNTGHICTASQLSSSTEEDTKSCSETELPVTNTQFTSVSPLKSSPAQSTISPHHSGSDKPKFPSA